MTTARWSFEATNEAPGSGRRAIREFISPARPTPRALASVAVCVTEALTNAVVHAYRNEHLQGGVEMDAELDGDWLRVRVRDQGHGLEPRIDSPGLGLGLPLISQLSASSTIITPEDGGTEVVMRFDLREPDERH